MENDVSWIRENRLKLHVYQLSLAGIKGAQRFHQHNGHILSNILYVSAGGFQHGPIAIRDPANQVQMFLDQFIALRYRQAVCDGRKSNVIRGAAKQIRQP